MVSSSPVFILIFWKSITSAVNILGVGGWFLGYAVYFRRFVIASVAVHTLIISSLRIFWKCWSFDMSTAFVCRHVAACSMSALSGVSM